MPESSPTLLETMKRAVTAYQRGQLSEAERLTRAIVSIRADHFDALHLLALVKARQRRFKQALVLYDQALALRPDFAQALNNRGRTLQEMKRPEEALASFDRALAVRPDFAEALYNRGLTLQVLKRLDEALVSYNGALSVRADFAQALNNRGNALKELQRFDEALASYDRALAVRPDFALAHVNKALLQLLRGEFNVGWRNYEWRWKAKSLTSFEHNFAQPRWLGDTAIAGKTILLHSEQGFGDTIQFCRYVPLIARQGARVLLNVPAELKDLMTSLAGVTEVVAAQDKLLDFDLHCPLLSLPLAFGTRLDSIPSSIPYVSASETRKSAWRERLGKRQKTRIGLVWSGEPRESLATQHRMDQQRSITFDRLEPILQVNRCDFYSLQKGEHAVAQLRESTLRHRVIDRTDELYDFADTAALIDQLDLIITVDTAVAHLTGALGKPFWLLNRHDTCWRWLLDREDSPWYPTARLFRQNAPGDWSGVIRRVVVELEKLLRASV